MKSKREIKEWLLENAVDEAGDLNLMYLDFSDFNGKVYINNMKVKNDLIQSDQETKGNLIQSHQKVEGNLTQNYQKTKGDLFQDCQKVQKSLIQNDQEVQKNLYQGTQKVKGNLVQSLQEVKGIFETQALKNDEEYEIDYINTTYIIKKEKEKNEKRI